MEEGALVVDDLAFAADFEERWLVDLSRSRQVTGRRPERDGGALQPAVAMGAS